MNIKHLQTADLIPYARNARKHDDAQVAQIAGSIKEFGFNNPVLIDKASGIIAGHGRVLAADKLYMETVPTICLEHLSETQKRAYILLDNRLAEKAEWDDEMLKLELGELYEDYDLDALGFEDYDLSLGQDASTEGLTDENETPDEPEEPVTVKGDVWLLGKHRVCCGDSTSEEDVAAVLNGVDPHLMVTDPPYGVNYDADWRNHTGEIGRSARAVGKVENDDRADWREAWSLFPGEVAYVWHAGNRANLVADSLQACGFELRTQIVWAKNQHCISRGHYHPGHEPCWYVVKKGGTGHWQGSRKESTLWQIDKPQKSETGHSTQKPVECMRRPIVNNSAPGDPVYDPFLGSGTTLIAGEKEGRPIYGMELSPQYCDVIVKRWQDYTGQEPTHAETGKTFNESH